MARKSGKPSTVKRPGSLDPEDMKLWDAVAKTTRPLPGRRPPAPASPSEKPRISESADRGSAEEKKTAKPGSQPEPRQTAPASPRLAELDRRLVQKLSRGRVSVDATIDLHGLRQAAAERQLHGFLLRCREQGLRLVLVITGKGRTAEEPSAIMAEDEPGVLKRVVPLWLAQPRFRELVVGYRQAARHHGGAGALYLQLRRLRDTASENGFR